MEPVDLTVRILQEIRDDLRGFRTDVNGRLEQVDKRLEQVDKRLEHWEARAELADQRFIAIETALRDMAEQFVVLGRGIKVAIEDRARKEALLDDHERRIAELERRTGS